jgi:hypothetical protein
MDFISPTPSIPRRSGSHVHNFDLEVYLKLFEVAIEEPCRLGSAQLTGIQFGPSKIELRLFDLQDDVGYNETTRVTQHIFFPATQLDQRRRSCPQTHLNRKINP